MSVYIPSFMKVTSVVLEYDWAPFNTPLHGSKAHHNHYHEPIRYNRSGTTKNYCGQVTYSQISITMTNTSRLQCRVQMECKQFFRGGVFLVSDGFNCQLNDLIWGFAMNNITVTSTSCFSSSCENNSSNESVECSHPTVINKPIVYFVSKRKEFMFFINVKINNFKFSFALSRPCFSCPNRQSSAYCAT